MKKIYTLLSTGILLVAVTLVGQTNKMEKLHMPFFDEESQSNIDVHVCDIGQGISCPIKYTNLISNTNLFTDEERELIEKLLKKYENISDFKTNSGPPGTVFKNLYLTNSAISAYGRVYKYTNWVAQFSYTNMDAEENMCFSGETLNRTTFLDKSGNGYNFSIINVGGGKTLQIMQSKGEKPNGFGVILQDSKLQEYRHYTNGMLIGKYLMWRPSNGRLLINADFKEPCDYKKHMPQYHWEK